MKSCFFICKRFLIFCKFIQYTIYWDKTQMLKKSPSDNKNLEKKNSTRFSLGSSNSSVLLLIHNFLHKLKHRVCFSNRECGIFHFWFCFVFIKIYTFVQQNAWTLWLQNIVPFKIKMIKKLHTILLPERSFLSFNKKF